jgi:acyl-CoA thioester hydrolase
MDQDGGEFCDLCCKTRIAACTAFGQGWRMAHQFNLRIYYEDTDLGGFVYYANYLKFIERGRSEWVRLCGVDQTALKAERGMLFVVRHLEAEYLAPAYFEDVLAVETELVTIAGSRIVLAQRVMRGDVVLFAAKVTLVCVVAGRAVRVPGDVAVLLA